MARGLLKSLKPGSRGAFGRSGGGHSSGGVQKGVGCPYEWVITYLAPEKPSKLVRITHKILSRRIRSLASDKYVVVLELAVSKFSQFQPVKSLRSGHLLRGPKKSGGD